MEFRRVLFRSEGEPGQVWGTPAVGLDARPGHRQPVAVDPEVAHETHVLGIPVVVVARDIASVATGHAARRVAEGVPDRKPATPLVHGTLDLVGRRRDAQLETAWQLNSADPLGCPC